MSETGYKVVRMIGQGAFGAVYLAQADTGGFRALKVVSGERLGGDVPFELEYKNVQELKRVSESYDTLIKIFDIGRKEELKQFYYFMELADDQGDDQIINPETYAPKTLRSEIQHRKRIPINECLSLGATLARALEDLHESGVVHQVINPGNVLFVRKRPKLSDIGMAAEKAAERNEGFIAPEGPGSPQADLYALGKTLYEMATGRSCLDYPHSPENLDDSERDLFLELKTVIAKACKRDLNERYQSARELFEDLVLLQRGMSVRNKGSFKKSLATVASIVGIAALAGGGMLAMIYLKGNAAREGAPVPSQTNSVNGSGDSLTNRPALIDSPNKN